MRMIDGQSEAKSYIEDLQSKRNKDNRIKAEKISAYFDFLQEKGDVI